MRKWKNPCRALWPPAEKTACRACACVCRNVTLFMKGEFLIKGKQRSRQLYTRNGDFYTVISLDAIVRCNSEFIAQLNWNLQFIPRRYYTSYIAMYKWYIPTKISCRIQFTYDQRTMTYVSFILINYFTKRIRLKQNYKYNFYSKETTLFHQIFIITRAYNNYI